MSDLLGQLHDLVSDEASQVEYKHELAISSFTNDVARMMLEKRVSQSELARRMGVSRARVSQLMQHRSSPTLRTMVQVAQALGCDVIPLVVPAEAKVPGTAAAVSAGGTGRRTPRPR
jgi:DNA-binding phage protein